jgi:hypothetical protein
VQRSAPCTVSAPRLLPRWLTAACGCAPSPAARRSKRDNAYPNKHDWDLLEAIYAHADRTNGYARRAARRMLGVQGGAGGVQLQEVPLPVTASAAATLDAGAIPLPTVLKAEAAWGTLVRVQAVRGARPGLPACHLCPCCCAATPAQASRRYSTDLLCLCVCACARARMGAGRGTHLLASWFSAHQSVGAKPHT